MRIEHECGSCQGYGLYQGIMEAPHCAVICIKCSGSGRIVRNVKQFTGRKKLEGVTSVRAGSGTILDRPDSAAWITYKEFERLVPKLK